MRQITINELTKEEIDKINIYLNKEMTAAPISGAFWVQLPETLIGESQKNHESCGPFVLGVEVGVDFVHFELLVRSQNNLHCSCTAHTTVDQREYVLSIFDKMTAELGIKA